jgi:hypothetical protein
MRYKPCAQKVATNNQRGNKLQNTANPTKENAVKMQRRPEHSDPMPLACKWHCR